MGARKVLIKGGHAPIESQIEESVDLLVSDQGEHVFTAPRIKTENTHGTGCSLSSAIAAGLANGLSMEEAIGAAKTWLTGAIAASDRLQVGKGHGPVHHFHNLWDK
jgi:hydroxymethylpyrimidine/phosphomethylpyrimidine kinase